VLISHQGKDGGTTSSSYVIRSSVRRSSTKFQAEEERSFKKFIRSKVGKSLTLTYQTHVNLYNVHQKSTGHPSVSQYVLPDDLSGEKCGKYKTSKIHVVIQCY